jgi:hypothetical protein
MVKNSAIFTLWFATGFKTALKRLLKNKLLMANIMAGVFYILGASGYMTYTIKYLETQFQKSAAGANVIAGTELS